MMAGTSMRLKASTRERAASFWLESGMVAVGVGWDCRNMV